VKYINLGCEPVCPS